MPPSQAVSPAPSEQQQSLTIGLISISDRASAGVYEDKGIPGLVDWFTAALKSPWRMETRLIPDEQPLIERALIELIDTVGCELVLTTGGTGPACRDVTPEATRAVCDRVLDGVPERMRSEGVKKMPFAALSRGVCGLRGRTLILNLPGSPAGAVESLEAVVELIPHALKLLQGHTEHSWEIKI